MARASNKNRKENKPVVPKSFIKERHCSALCSIMSVTPAGAIISPVTASSCHFSHSIRQPSVAGTIKKQETGENTQSSRGE